MSLLNDMLRDLSHQKPVADGNEGYDATLLSSASFSQKKNFSWVSVVAIFITVFVVVLFINYALHKPVVNEKLTDENTSGSMSLNTDADKAAASPDETSAPAVTPIDQGVKQNAITEQAESKPVKSDELNNHITDLMQQAERALGMDRLTAPVEDNAYGYYQKVLTMDASNEDAKFGLDEIAKRYLAKAQEQFAIGNSQAALALIQRARFVSPRFVQAHEINLDESAVHVSDVETTDIHIGEVQPTAQHQVQEKIRGAQDSSPTETIKPFNVVEANKVSGTKNISISPNAGWKDEQLAQHARELITQNKQNEAKLALKNFIAVEQKPVLSATLLADIYIQQGNTEAASIIADQASYLPIDIKSKIQAQVLSANGDNARAIAILEKNLIAGEENEEYRSFLASLYHKTANYQQSIISYQRLMNRFGEKPAYWLGLALAYDGLSQHQSALQAYQRLRAFPQLQEQVTQYTDQRIAALRSE